MPHQQIAPEEQSSHPGTGQYARRPHPNLVGRQRWIEVRGHVCVIKPTNAQVVRNSQAKLLCLDHRTGRDVVIRANECCRSQTVVRENPLHSLSGKTLILYPRT